MESFIKKVIRSEERRQYNAIELIASENFVSPEVRAAAGSALTNKYAEGYPSKESVEIFKKEFPDYIHTGNSGRYYGGCENVDQIELYARYRFQQLFNCVGTYHVNVQPHSGSQANYAAYTAILKPGDTILSMKLENGGHLTHGSSVNFSGKIYNAHFYGVDSDGFIDYKDLAKKILECKPKVVVAGASAYPREIDFNMFKSIIDASSLKLGYTPYFMVDMSHIAGLITAGEHQSPFGLADIITTTTHKTLRGPRGGLIFCKHELAKAIDSAIFPGTQGGPLMHIILAKAIAADEALQPSYKEYIHNVVVNCKAMADVFLNNGFKLVTNGTDNHLFLLDFSDKSYSGSDVQKLLDANGITANKNCVPNDSRGPIKTSGLRIGTAAMTTNGFTKEDFEEVAYRIINLLK